MAVSPSVEVNILPGTVSAGGIGVDFTGAFLTNDVRISPTYPYAFFDAQSIGDYFGTQSVEYQMGVAYMGGVLNARQQPSTYIAIRVLDVASSGRVDGAPLTGMTLAQLQALTGTLIVTVAGTAFTSSSINLSAASSFSNAATLMLAAFTAPTFAIGYDNLRNAFFISTSTTGATQTILVVTGTLAAGVKLDAASGAQVQQGAAADTDFGSALTRAVNAAQTFCTYASAYQYNDAQRQQLAAWNQSFGGSKYAAVLHDTEGAAVIPANPASFGNTIIANKVDGVVPVYNSSVHAAVVQGYAAGLNMSAVNGRGTIAYRQPVASIPYSCTDTPTYRALVSNGYTFYAQFADGAISYNHFCNGQIGGQYLWLDSYLGQIWLRRLLQNQIRIYFEAVPMVPYTPADYAALKAAWKPVVTAAITNGVIRVGVTATDLQVQVLANLTGLSPNSIKTALETTGYLAIIRDPANVAQRQARTSPYCLFAYMDGQGVQSINMTAYDVL